VRILQRVVPWLTLAVLVGGTISWIQRPGDFAGYVLVGDAALRGEHIYRGAAGGVNTWPPFFSLLCVPLALLARPTPYLARGVWLALNYLLLWTALKISARLVYRRDLRWQPSPGALSLAAPEIFLPLILCYRFILGNFDHLQVNIVIFTSALAGLYWHARDRNVRGGIALGFAAALKVMPIVFVPYLLYRRRYAVATTAAVSAAAFSLSPILVYGWPRFVEYIAAWRAAIAPGWGVGKMNQSVFAMFDRYIGQPVPPWRAPALAVLPESGHPAVAIASAAALIVITAMALYLFRGREAPDSPASLVEYSVVFIVSALFGPLAWKAYLVVLALPCMLLVRFIREPLLAPTQHRVLLAALALYFVLAGLTTPGLVGQRIAGTLEMLSNTTVATLVILVTLLWLRTRMRAR